MHSFRCYILMLASLKFFQCESVSLDIEIDRLSDRLSLLDSKISLDLISLRQDLEDVRRSVSDNTKDKEARKALSTTDEYQKFTFDVSALHGEIENCYKKEHALLIAFREEKRRRKEIERKLDAFKTEVFEDIKMKVSDLVESSKQHAVSFSARANKHEDMQPWETLIFPDVGHNRGGAYNHSSGIFVAPVSGTYVFYCNILTKEDSYIEMAMLVNTQIKLLIYSAGKNNLGPGSNMLVIDLEEGDAVKVAKYGPWGSRPFYVHNTWSTFSGFLLSKA